MAEPVRLTLPSPPSGNRYWRVPKALGRPILSKEAREYRQRVAEIAVASGVRQPLEGPLSVIVEWYRPARRGDLDNTLKVVLDALQGTVYDNDSQIVRILALRHDAPPGRLVVQVSETAESPITLSA